MIQIKKTILTLVALIAVTTGAWADYTVTWEGTTLQGIAVSSNSVHAPNTTQTVEGITVTASNGDFFYNTSYPGKPVVMASSSANNGLVFSAENNIKSIAITFTEVASYGGSTTFGAGAYTYQVSPAAKSFALPKNDNFTGITKVVFTLEGDAPVAASAVTVDWNKTEKTGTFDMPGGNVELEPEYYPQATAAEGAVTAATDVKATTDAPLVTIDDTKLTGAAKMMYYASTDATAPAYDATGWTDELPTAEKFTEAGNVNVWYYPVGTDEGVGGATATYSDGDMNATALTVTIAAEPTYAVTFAEGTDLNEWNATPNTGLKQGDDVTVTYTGSKKVIGVKAAKKKAAPKLLTLNIGGETSATIYYIEGESWKNAIENHPTENAGWRAITDQITYDGSAYVLFYGGGNTKVNPEENIDSTKTYKMES